MDGFLAEFYPGSYDDLRAVRVVVGGETVLDRHFDDTRGESSDVASVTKSVLSLLVGIAIGRGEIRGVDMTLGQLLPERRDEMAAGVASVTLEQVLTMTGGLAEDGPDGAIEFEGAGNWVRAILGADLEQPPGTSFAYSSAGSHLLSAILVEATGRPVLEYAREHLFGPVGIDTTQAAQIPLVATEENIADYEAADFAWPVDRQGYHAGYGWLKLTVDDMTRIGQLMLNGGAWEGRQVVPIDWVEQATRGQVEGTSTSHARITPGYGYQWWVTTADGHPAYAAAGHGGQLIEVVPGLDLVVVVSAHIPPDRPPRTKATGMVQLVDFVIAPALQR